MVDSTPDAEPMRKITFTLPASVDDAFRAALYWTHSTPDGVSTVSWWIEEAIRDRTKILEDRYNGGKPFSPAPRSVRRGRPPRG